MAEPKGAPDAILFAAVFSRHREAIHWAADQIRSDWGRIALVSPCFDHSETSYYAAEMGAGLLKQFFVIDGRFNPARLAETKLESNRWERTIAESDQFDELRPVNIDPGYVTLSKLILASAKDRAHRIYLDQGIYAEECLHYLGGRWHCRPWTYPDYQRADFQEFFCTCRELLKRYLATDWQAV